MTTKTAPISITHSPTGDQPFVVRSYDDGRRAQMIRAGVAPDDALAASGVLPGRGRVVVAVESLNAIIARCDLSPEETQRFLANGRPTV